jgi:FKBP-type peptidyl-prolyl cis-trans isomerase FklB
MLRKSIVFAALTASSTLCFAAEKVDLSGDKQQFSYAIGYQIGNQLAGDGLDVDAAALSQAISDVLNNKEPQLSTEKMQAAVTNYQNKLNQQRQMAADKNLKKGQDFLAANKDKDGIVTLDNGMQYKVLKKGSGDKPGAEDTVEVNYHGTLIDGTVFDSSYDRGEAVSFPVNRVIKGWQEILPMMSEGAKWKVFIPSELAYGERGAGASIGPNETLIFDIELLAIKN